MLGTGTMPIHNSLHGLLGARLLFCSSTGSVFKEVPADEIKRKMATQHDPNNLNRSNSDHAGAASGSRRSLFQATPCNSL